MRLNRGTVLLLVVGLIVIVAVLVITINQAAAPGDEDTDDQGLIEGDVENDQETDLEVEQSPLFPGVDTASLVRLEVRSNLTGERMVLIKQDDDRWGMGDPDGIGPEQENTGVVEEVPEEPAEIQSTEFGEIDQARVGELLDQFLSVEAVEAFEAEELDEFGLARPAYTIFAVANAGEIYVMYVGDTNPSSTRYYTVIEQLTAGDTSPRLPELRGELDRLDIDTSLDEVVAPGAEIPELPEELAGQGDLIEMQQTLVALDEDDPQRPDLVATYSAIIEARNAAIGEALEDEEDEEVPAQAPEAVEPAELAPADEEGLEDAEGEGTVPVIPDEGLAEVDTDEIAFSVPELEGPEIVRLIPVLNIDPLIALLTTPPVIEVLPETPAPTLVPLEPEAREAEDDEVIEEGEEIGEAEGGA